MNRLQVLADLLQLLLVALLVVRGHAEDGVRGGEALVQEEGEGGAGGGVAAPAARIGAKLVYEAPAGDGEEDLRVVVVPGPRWTAYEMKCLFTRSQE